MPEESGEIRLADCWIDKRFDDEWYDGKKRIFTVRSFPSNYVGKGDTVDEAFTDLLMQFKQPEN